MAREESIPAGDDPFRGDEPPVGASAARRRGWLEKRRDRVRAEIDRNRRGDYKVPTWVLGLILLAVVAAWAALIIFG